MLHWIIFLLLITQMVSAAKQNDIYDEELVMRRLTSGNIAAQFRFTTTTHEFAAEFDLFPKVIAEFVQQYALSELHFSLAQGFWRTQLWGNPPQPAAPTGAQISAWFDGNSSSVDERWQRLVHAVNGLFCASFLQISPILTARPLWSFRPKSALEVAASDIIDFSLMGRYGALSSDAICTENLTPWKKLLPCKEAGLALLLHPIKFYESQYHSMSLDLIRIFEPDSKLTKWQLTQTLVVVYDRQMNDVHMDWSLQSLFNGRIYERCAIARTSAIFANDLKEINYNPSPNAFVTAFDGVTFARFDISFGRIPLNIVARFTNPMKLAPIDHHHVIWLHSYIAGAGQHRGELITRIANDNNANQRIVYCHVIPWFLRIYYHTITINCHSTSASVIRKASSFTPGRDRQSPHLLELDLIVPAASVCHLSVAFEKSFLRWNEYPPDASKGLFIPAPSITYRADGWHNVSFYGALANDDDLQSDRTHPMLTVFGEALLVVLAVPDFSMPYNVICLVCTVIALCFGPVHSLTTKRLTVVFNRADEPTTIGAKVRMRLVKLLNLFKSTFRRQQNTLNDNRQ